MFVFFGGGGEASSVALLPLLCDKPLLIAPPRLSFKGRSLTQCGSAARGSGVASKPRIALIITRAGRTLGGHLAALHTAFTWSARLEGLSEGIEGCCSWPQSDRLKGNTPAPASHSPKKL